MATCDRLLFALKAVLPEITVTAMVSIGAAVFWMSGDDSSGRLLFIGAAMGLAGNLLTSMFLNAKGRERFKGVRFMRGGDRNYEFKESLKKSSILDNFDSEQIVKIWDISIANLIWGLTDKESEVSEHALGKALSHAVKSGRIVQVLLARPDSLVIRQRSKDLSKKPEYIDRINRTIGFLHNFRKKLASEGGNSENLIVRLFDKLPSNTVYVSGGYTYLGFYPPSSNSDTGVIIRMLDNNEIARTLHREFDEVFAKHSVSLSAYMEMTVWNDDSTESYPVWYLPRDSGNSEKTPRLRPEFIALSDNSHIGAHRYFGQLEPGSLVRFCLDGHAAAGPSASHIGMVEGWLEATEATEQSKNLAARYGGKEFDLASTIILKMDTVADELHEAGYSYTKANHLTNLLFSNVDFRVSWTRLAEDKFLSKLVPRPSTKRDRRIARYYLTDIKSDKLKWDQLEGEFNQGSSNILYPGSRHFLILEDKIATNKILKDLIFHDLKRMTIGTPDAVHLHWRIYVHQFRVTLLGSDGCSQSEGIHQDGHDYVSMHLVERNVAKGGESRIYDSRNSKRPIRGEVLGQSNFNSLYINDRMVYHEISEIYGDPSSSFRDMLIIDYEKIPEIPSYLMSVGHKLIEF